MNNAVIIQCNYYKMLLINALLNHAIVFYSYSTQMLLRKQALHPIEPRNCILLLFPLDVFKDFSVSYCNLFKETLEKILHFCQGSFYF